MAIGRLSELESVVLGIVWKFGPCTPHAVRAHFLTSRSARFSASAGAIYPLMARLERARLLRSHSDRRRRQRRRLYAVTPAGTRRLRDWLAPPLRPSDLAALHDPIRARVYFLGALTAAGRRRFLAAAESGLRLTERLLFADLRDARDRGGSGRAADAANAALTALALRGALEVTRAQIRWLRTIKRRALMA